MQRAMNAVIKGGMTTRGVAERIGRTRRHVGYLVRVGSLDGFKVRGEWLISPESVDRYIEKRQRAIERGEFSVAVQ